MHSAATYLVVSVRPVHTAMPTLPLAACEAKRDTGVRPQEVRVPICRVGEEDPQIITSAPRDECPGPEGAHHRALLYIINPTAAWQLLTAPFPLSAEKEVLGPAGTPTRGPQGKAEGGY